MHIECRVLHSRAVEPLAAKKACPFNELDNVWPVVCWPAAFFFSFFQRMLVLSSVDNVSVGMEW